MEFIFGLLIFLGIPIIICIALGLIISNIVIRLIKKKMNIKNETYKELIYALIMVICLVVSLILGQLFIRYKSAEPDKLYVKMNKINDEQSLIGLSKEQVIERLGKPYGKEEQDVYYYDAGKITNYFFFGESDSYTLKVFFNENDIHLSNSL